MQDDNDLAVEPACSQIPYPGLGVLHVLHVYVFSVLNTPDRINQLINRPALVEVGMLELQLGYRELVMASRLPARAKFLLLLLLMDGTFNSVQWTWNILVASSPSIVCFSIFS